MGKSVLYFGGVGSNPHDGVIPTCIESTVDPLITAPNAGFGTEYPAGLTLDQLCEFYWRAKTLKIDYNLSDSDAVYNGVYVPFTRAVDHESELACFEKWDDFLFVTPFENASFVFDGLIYYYNGKYYPRIALTMSPYAITNYNSAGSGVSNPGIDCRVEFSDSSIVTIPMVSLDLEVAGTIVVSVNEYFDYAQRSDGLSVYDSSTGLVLAGRDPFN